MAKLVYTLEITNDYMAGHGVYPDFYRATVYAETPERPIMKSAHRLGSFDRALEVGRELYMEVVNNEQA